MISCIKFISYYFYTNIFLTTIISLSPVIHITISGKCKYVWMKLFVPWDRMIVNYQDDVQQISAVHHHWSENVTAPITVSVFVCSDTGKEVQSKVHKFPVCYFKYFSHCALLLKGPQQIYNLVVGFTNSCVLQFIKKNIKNSIIH